jgi:hypothetical protein
MSTLRVNNITPTGSLDTVSINSSLNVQNAVTASYFVGDGSQLLNIPFPEDQNGFPYTGSAIITGSLEVLGPVNVIGKVTAEEYFIQYISSSVIYQSGSTKFGDSGDDTHEFTGSVLVSGSISAESFSGSFVGDGSGLQNLSITPEQIGAVKTNTEGSVNITQIWAGTQAEYDLIPSPSASTLYVIVG